jgi:hypothetical protein
MPSSGYGCPAHNPHWQHRFSDGLDVLREREGGDTEVERGREEERGKREKEREKADRYTVKEKNGQKE